MKRSPPSLQFLAVVSSRPPYRGGRKQWRRGYSDRNGGDQFVTGDSHFRSVRDANRSFGPEERTNFENHSQFRPRSPSFNSRPSFNPNAPPFNPNQQFRPPPFYQNQQFRPPPFQQNQQFRPRPQKPLDYRNWEYAKPGPPPDCERFTVLSYNILADYLAINHRSKLYYHIPRHILDWEFRMRSIIFELGLWSADILCFQEVDRFQDLEADLKVRGYNGIWKMRTGDPVDGCAIFWRVSRFKLLHEESIEFSKLGLRDNVGQICVFESLNQSQNHNRSTPGLSASAAGYNKVVICNIHVLYNPRRGEIKLGQVRVLLERAYAVSKLWGDAPVVLCGDFNCTPESPLYTFISEQKLNLSELPRDKLSGQASAEIRPQRQFSPNFRGPPSDNSARAPTMVEPAKTEVHQGEYISKDETEFTRCAPVCDLNECTTRSQSEDVSKDETELIRHAPVSDLNERTISFRSEAGSSVSQMKDEINEYSPPNSHQEDIDPIEIGFRRDTSNASENSQAILQAENKGSDLFHEIPSSNVLEVSYQENSKNWSSLSHDNECADISYASTDDVVHKTMENLSVNEPVEATEENETLGEDCDTFLSELHNADNSQFPRSDFLGFNENEAPNEFILSPQQLDSEPFNVERSTYDPSAWTPMEIETATGSSECTLIEHPLKLRSTYSEVEDLSGTRDSNGEPLVTSYNRCFLGTVDYIWCSQGLQTVRVLAPIPRHAMQWTPGFPTKKWGSDHIALVSELAFTKDVTLENSEVE